MICSEIQTPQSDGQELSQNDSSNPLSNPKLQSVSAHYTLCSVWKCAVEISSSTSTCKCSAIHGPLCQGKTYTCVFSLLALCLPKEELSRVLSGSTS